MESRAIPALLDRRGARPSSARLLRLVTDDYFRAIFIATSWPRPADEPEVSLFHDGTFLVSPQ
jgi:hypothetical protein